MNITQNEIEQPRLFKDDLKFMDWWHVTNDYLKSSSLNQEDRKELMIRIHDYSLHLQNIVKSYPLKKEDLSPQVYESVESGLKETIRRAKISMARNPRFNSTFAGYWKFLAGVLKNDSVLLKDDKLREVFLTFDKTADSIQVA